VKILCSQRDPGDRTHGAAGNRRDLSIGRDLTSGGQVSRRSSLVESTWSSSPVRVRYFCLARMSPAETYVTRSVHERGRGGNRSLLRFVVRRIDMEVVV